MARKFCCVCAGMLLIASCCASSSKAQVQPILVSGDANAMVLQNGDIFIRASDGTWASCLNMLQSAGVPGGTTTLVGVLFSCSYIGVGIDGTMYNSVNCSPCGAYYVDSNIFDEVGEPRGNLTFAAGTQYGAIAFSQTGTVYRGTATGGQAMVWTSEGSVFSDLLGVNAPRAPRLSVAITPNPTRQGIGVVLSLPTAADIEVELVDVQGRRVARPISARLPAGSDQRLPDLVGAGESIPSGTYFVRVRAGTQLVTSRAVVLQ